MTQSIYDDVARESDTRRVAVVGLGYVGAPLAYELYRAGHDVIGYDIDPVRADESSQRAAQIESDRAGATFRATTLASALVAADTFVIAVPTPSRDGQPDLSLVLRACEDVGAALQSGDLVIIESTVYPGVTREHCRPVLEKMSGLTAGVDFGLSFSPERINPGDDKHTVTEVVKVVSGVDEQSAAAAAELYTSAVPAGVHVAPSLEVAELAKLLENTQRDVNIALMNEVNLLAQRLGIRFGDVLAACATKWNFGKYTPGLVGGHCIAEDPYYLLGAAANLGLRLPTVESARRTNEELSAVIAHRIRTLRSDGRVLIYGATYKPDVADVRNAGASQLKLALERLGIDVQIVDRLLDGGDFPRGSMRPAETVVVANVHEQYRDRLVGDLDALLSSRGLVIDMTGTLSLRQLPVGADLLAW